MPLRPGSTTPEVGRNLDARAPSPRAACAPSWHRPPAAARPLNRWSRTLDRARCRTRLKIALPRGRLGSTPTFGASIGATAPSPHCYVVSRRFERIGLWNLCAAFSVACDHRVAGSARLLGVATPSRPHRRWPQLRPRSCQPCLRARYPRNDAIPRASPEATIER